MTLYHKILFFLVLLFGCNILAAQPTERKEGFVMPATVIGGDTIPTLKVKTIVILPAIEFTDKDDIKKYRKLIRDIKKVYPYSKIAKDTFNTIQLALDSIQGKKARKEFLEFKEEELLGKYSQELKKLTINQGRILLKLIDRELNKTSYELIKEFRGSFSAFFWQRIAKLFGEDLKTQFDSEGEDKLIERIIIMIENGQL